MEHNIPINKKIFSLSELNDLGFSAYMVRKMVAHGFLEKLNKWTYENKQFEGGDSDYIYAYAYVPDGIICLSSAAVYYGLTTYRPDVVNVAVARKRNVTTLPEWPTIALWYFDESRLKTGISEMEACGQMIKIYDVEKTVVDFVSYRNRVGIEETKEILVNYLKKENRDINKLCRYAEKLRCRETMETYLEVLV